MDQEMELLKNAPPRLTQPPKEEADWKGKKKEESDIWKLDAPIAKFGQSPVLDRSGKVTMHFTSHFIKT
jgi:immunoglobulin-binding protein 1